MYRYDLDFRNQIKARLLGKAVIQIVRESTLAPEDFLTSDGRPRRQLQDPATLAWNLSTTTFFKCEGRPWQLANVRPHVCYVGLTYKRDDTDPDPKNVCCGAQMFLNSGDGVVFRGAMGPWYVETEKSYHLSEEESGRLVHEIIEAYKRKRGQAPAELFLHGRTKFSEEEWRGFRSAVPASTNVVGVKINGSSELKLYRGGTHPVIRGTAYLLTDRKAFLWSAGYTPRLRTYPGFEVPNALKIEIQKGDADLMVVLADVLALTKLNYNACIFADSKPVTLRFADQVGDILTAAPRAGTSDLPLPFRYYI
ncbi:MAG: hypothetical protein MN733_34015 [Nitrososphaera sp.]|nr:hypothetical protein [Nitrososphaera sp.]